MLDPSLKNMGTFVTQRGLSGILGFDPRLPNYWKHNSLRNSLYHTVIYRAECQFTTTTTTTTTTTNNNNNNNNNDYYNNNNSFQISLHVK